MIGLLGLCPQVRARVKIYETFKHAIINAHILVFICQKALIFGMFMPVMVL